MRTEQVVLSARLSLLALTVVLSPLAAPQTPNASAPVPRLFARPLYEAARALESTYAVPVTYEDPILRWRGDMDGREAGGSVHFLPKKGLFALPDDVTPSRTPKLDAGALGRVLDLFHSLNPDGPHFRLLQSRYAFHILPETILGENGRRVGATSLLDVKISVPEDARLPSGHIRAICDAVSSASGIKLGFFGPDVDGPYAPNGLVPPKPELLTLDDEATQRRYYFTWGAPDESAREALISLLEGSATTLTWHLLCSANDDPAQRACMLNMSAMQINVTGPDGRSGVRALEFDRCGSNCPPLGATFPAPAITMPSVPPRRQR